MKCETCIICLDDVSKKEKVFDWFGKWNYLQTCNCQYHVHDTCFQKWYMYSEKCPYCKNPMYIRTLYYWQRYGKSICYYGFHISMSLWGMYMVYNVIYDYDFYIF